MTLDAWVLRGSMFLYCLVVLLSVFLARFREKLLTRTGFPGRSAWISRSRQQRSNSTRADRKTEGLSRVGFQITGEGDDRVQNLYG